MQEVLKIQIRNQAPRIQNEIITRIEEIISHVVKNTPLETPIERWNTSFLLKVLEGKIVGQVITNKADILAEFDMGYMFMDTLTNRMIIPKKIKQNIIRQLGNGNLEDIAKNKLKNNYILAKYNQNFELETYYITKDSSTKRSISTFIKEADLQT